MAGLLVLAVKPQIMDAVLEEIATAVTADHLVISIAAGVTIGRIQAGLRAPAPVVRVMPNTPALVLAGAAALAPGEFVRPEHLDLARAIFDTVGKTVVLDEKYLDAVTGLSGSGPAYVFLFLEALADGAVAMGLTRPEARLLAAQTVLGSAKLALESGKHTGELKDMVVSPGGTTAAGLAVLEKRAFRSAVIEAVAAATLRSKELGLKG
jgi:pyrroline-5-carboxylate reductase